MEYMLDHIATTKNHSVFGCLDAYCSAILECSSDQSGCFQVPFGIP